jgi:hypothetical protein
MHLDALCAFRLADYLVTCIFASAPHGVRAAPLLQLPTISATSQAHTDQQPKFVRRV